MKTPETPRTDLIVADGAIRIPSGALDERFSRSGGPGGQNVNKVSSRVEIRLDLARAEAVFSPEQLARIRERLLHRISGEGVLRVVSDRHRDQPRNREDCRAKLRELLEMALRVEKKRRRTRPTRGAKERRLAEKRKRSQRKRDRRGGDE